MASIERINNEITRVKAKLTEYQTRLRDLEKQKTDAENCEIVGIVRDGKISSEELSALLQAFNADKKPTTERTQQKLKSEQEESDNEA